MFDCSPVGCCKSGNTVEDEASLLSNFDAPGDDIALCLRRHCISECPRYLQKLHLTRGLGGSFEKVPVLSNRYIKVSSTLRHSRSKSLKLIMLSRGTFSRTRLLSNP